MTTPPPPDDLPATISVEERPAPSPPADGDLPDRHRRARTFLGWAISTLFVLALVYTVPLRDVWEGLRRVDPWSVLGAMALVGLSLWLRGGRWSLLFSSHHRVRSKDAAEVAVLGLALNAVLPGRVGEVARVAIASQRFGMRIAFAAATVVAERLLDGTTLFLFLGLALVALPTSVEPRSVALLGSEVSGTALTTGFVSLGAFCVLLALAILAMSLSKPDGLAIHCAGRLPEALARDVVPRLRSLLVALNQGLAGLRRGRTLARLALYSVGIWLSITVANLVVAHGIEDLHLSFGQTLVVTAVSVAASSLPSAPGAWGVFEAGGVLALQALQPDLDTGLAVAFMIAAHVCQFLPTVGLGYLLWLRRRHRGRPARAAGSRSPEGY